MRSIKIAMMSFADINNYGDILFSHVFNMEFRKRLSDVDIHFYTPSTIDLEGYHYQGYEKEKVDDKYDGVFLAGGEVVHLFDERTWKPIYEKQGKSVISEHASDTVWDWVTCRCRFKAWLSVGVRPFGDKWDESKVFEAVDSLDYISCRGILSKKVLEDSNFEKFNKKIGLTPDLGWIFPQYLDDLNLRGKYYLDFISPNTKYLLFQVHNVTEEEAKIIAGDLLKAKEKYGYQIVMMPVIHLWQDEIYLEQINEFAGNEFIVLPNDLSVFQMLDVIVHASLAVTSSLHVAITALADGVPASVFNKWQGSKLQDLYGLQFRTDFLVSDVGEFAAIFEKLEYERQHSKSLSLYAQFMREKLKETFDDVVNRLVSST
ncbi:polysaccharide pyruvyl transferase family protein [Sphingobacterium sp. SGR-19]|uniref:polysaccharide pyruvyl transferase family protein n=1 Tax=Sphingobacterium sp. SGR-19 TaxID=2710886 RepID=UPI0013EB3C60|nr:polysaccharide pyruvyl transferase family protein [Sphingobacterium sp. SGR-19]NGM67215.1 polysaccharide pyruvyl transferase family protein [Sphingobacterium sp. SGR-19]